VVSFLLFKLLSVMWAADSAGFPAVGEFRRRSMCRRMTRRCLGNFVGLLGMCALNRK